MAQENMKTSSSAGEPSGRKLGLALSGGGFRASFFHVGVLAQMARLGILHRVEVISTVSGGSIIGALYYLHVKRLLEEKPDEDITSEDYAKIVECMEKRFCDAVEENLRMLTFASPTKNLQMRKPEYSRSDRIGEIYDEYLYRPALKPLSTRPIEMRQLRIFPKTPNGDRDTGFHPDLGNTERKAKVPILLINATTLNNGHNWRFEAIRMGTPLRKNEMEIDIDKNFRLMMAPSYEDITKRQQDIELGLAVAASACVPGIFHPLAISELYARDIRVQLVDGGVHDNQGVQGLIDRQCGLMVVSDACGQMSDERSPDTTVAGVLTRTNAILMDRVREEQILRVMKQDAHEVALIHLRKGIEVQTVFWNRPDGQPFKEPPIDKLVGTTCQDFGVTARVQERLSQIRTDLDSFSEVEAFSLMADGYLMSEKVLQDTPGMAALIAGSTPLTNVNWRFLKISPWLCDPTSDFLRHLDVASQRLFKPFRLSWPLTTGTALILALLLWFVLSSSLVRHILSFSMTLGSLLFLVAVGVLVILLPWASKTFEVLGFLRSPARRTVDLLAKAVLPAAGSVFVQFYLKTLNPLFLWLGRIERLHPPRSAGQDRKQQQKD